MAFSPSHTGMVAMGSYSQTTAIYREDNMELLYVLHGQEGGVTHVSQHTFFIHSALITRLEDEGDNFVFQVQFSKDGNYLYTGGRKVRCNSYSFY